MRRNLLLIAALAVGALSLTGQAINPWRGVSINTNGIANVASIQFAQTVTAGRFVGEGVGGSAAVLWTNVENAVLSADALSFRDRSLAKGVVVPFWKLQALDQYFKDLGGERGNLIRAGCYLFDYTNCFTPIAFSTNSGLPPFAGVSNDTIFDGSIPASGWDARHGLEGPLGTIQVIVSPRGDYTAHGYGVVVTRGQTNASADSHRLIWNHVAGRLGVSAVGKTGIEFLGNASTNVPNLGANQHNRSLSLISSLVGSGIYQGYEDETWRGSLPLSAATSGDVRVFGWNYWTGKLGGYYVVRGGANATTFSLAMKRLVRTLGEQYPPPAANENRLAAAEGRISGLDSNTWWATFQIEQPPGATFYDVTLKCGTRSFAYGGQTDPSYVPFRFTTAEPAGNGNPSWEAFSTDWPPMVMWKPTGGDVWGNDERRSWGHPCSDMGSGNGDNGYSIQAMAGIFGQPQPSSWTIYVRDTGAWFHPTNGLEWVFLLQSESASENWRRIIPAWTQFDPRPRRVNFMGWGGATFYYDIATPHQRP